MNSGVGKTGRGLTLVEILVAIMVLTFLLALAIPAFYSMLRRSQLDAAARQLVSDLREAQSKATLTGWQYRLVGFDINNTGTFKNQYRLVGRSSSAVAWPADTSPTFTSATQMANPWINVNTVYPGVRLDTSDATDRFFVSFDARGAAFEINSFPLQVLHESGAKQCVGVTTAGNIRTQGCP